MAASWASYSIEKTLAKKQIFVDNEHADVLPFWATALFALRWNFLLVVAGTSY